LASSRATTTRAAVASSLVGSEQSTLADAGGPARAMLDPSRTRRAGDLHRRHQVGADLHASSPPAGDRSARAFCAIVGGVASGFRRLSPCP
jgi:hypothetical protein